MQKVGKSPDGRLIGEKDGRLYYGIKRRVTLDQLTMKYDGDDMTLMYGDQVVGHGYVEGASKGQKDGPLSKSFKNVLVIRQDKDGNEVETVEASEKTMEVVDWEEA